MERGRKRAWRREAFAGWAQLWGPALERPLPGHPRQQSPREEEGGPGQVSLRRGHGGRPEGEAGR